MLRVHAAMRQSRQGVADEFRIITIVMIMKFFCGGE